MRRVLLLFVLAVPLFAQQQRTTIEIGDAIVIAPMQPSGIGFFDPPFPILLDDSAAIKTTMRNLPASAAAFDAQGHLLLGYGPSITVLEDQIFVLGGIGLGQPFRDAVMAIAPAPNGELFVLTASSDVLEVSADGGSIKRIVLPAIGFPVVNANIDLGPDGCTLYYLDHDGEIARYDVCAGVALPKFLPNLGFTAFRVLGDGGVAAASGQTLLFYDPAARLFKTIALSGSPATSIAFDADPAYVWAVTPGTIAKIRISDGRAVNVQTLVVDSIAIRGERRPATIEITGAVRRRGTRH